MRVESAGVLVRGVRGVRLRSRMADLPARKVHPLNYIAGGIVHLAVDWPLNIIVNIINPLDVWHYPESWR